MQLLRTILLFVFAMLMGNCIEPYTIPPSNEPSLLVVDGLITTEPGPHFVKLSRSTTLNETAIEKPVESATLWIMDNMGEQINLIETSPGMYQTTPAAWHAESGKSYIFQIELSDGRLFRSTEQEIYSSGTIDSLFATFSPNAISNVDDPSLSQDAFSLFLNASGEVGLLNLFRWRWKSTYEIFTRPELTQTAIPGCCLVPDPLPCSGYNNALVSVQPCTCCTCWVTEYSRQARVSANQFANENLFQGVNLAKIPVDGLRFYNKYHVEVEQLGLDESSYSFWKLVQAQQAGATNIFQPNVIRIQGNISNVADPKDKALGVVSFASITRKSIFINRSEILGTKPSLPVVILDCTDYDETSTTTKPIFW
jgi:hypothetical protein